MAAIDRWTRGADGCSRQLSFTMTAFYRSTLYDSKNGGRCRVSTALD